MEVPQLLRPGKCVGINRCMVLELLARIEYESASEHGERHRISMSGLDPWDDILATVRPCQFPDFTSRNYLVSGEIAVQLQPDHRFVFVFT